jgi:hypothetical protein
MSLFVHLVSWVDVDRVAFGPTCSRIRPWRNGFELLGLHDDESCVAAVDVTGTCLHPHAAQHHV